MIRLHTSNYRAKSLEGEKKQQLRGLSLLWRQRAMMVTDADGGAAAALAVMFNHVQPLNAHTQRWINNNSSAATSGAGFACHE